MIFVLFLLACDDKSKSDHNLTRPSVAQLQKACLRHMEDDRCHNSNAEPYKHTSVCDYGYWACDQVQDYLYNKSAFTTAPSMLELQGACIDYMQYDRCHDDTIPYEHRYDTSFCQVGAIMCTYVDKYVAEHGVPIK